MEDVLDKIRERYNHEIGKKFEGKHSLFFVDHFPGLLPLSFPGRILTELIFHDEKR